MITYCHFSIFQSPTRRQQPNRPSKTPAAWAGDEEEDKENNKGLANKVAKPKANAKVLSNKTVQKKKRGAQLKSPAPVIAHKTVMQFVDDSAVINGGDGGESSSGGGDEIGYDDFPFDLSFIQLCFMSNVVSTVG